jgi:ribose 5-phosphate isomerase RpiB
MPETIIVGSDHAGFALKEKVKVHLEQRGFAVEDVGALSEQRSDYPLFAHALAEAVAAGRHLLETVYGVPVIVKPMRTVRTRPAA